MVARHRADDTSRRLATIPRIGRITALAIAAAVPDVARKEVYAAVAASQRLSCRPLKLPAGWRRGR